MKTTTLNIVTVIDHFTVYAWAEPIYSKSASCVGEKLINLRTSLHQESSTPTMAVNSLQTQFKFSQNISGVRQ